MARRGVRIPLVLALRAHTSHWMDSTATAPGRKSAAGTPVQVSRGTPSAAAEIVVMRRDVTDCGSCRICGREERVHKLLGNAKNVFPQLPQSFLMHSPAPRECVMPRVQGVSRSGPTRTPWARAASRRVGKSLANSHT